MKEIIAKCGYRCDLCPAYAPNIADEEEAKTVCEKFHDIYGFQLKPEEVACVGCLSEGRHIDRDCPVRPCVTAKGFETCAQCAGFDGCEKLKTRMDFLEPLPEKLAHLPKDNFKKYVVPYQSKPHMTRLRAGFLGGRSSR
jgi:hypothetical protein